MKNQKTGKCKICSERWLNGVTNQLGGCNCSQKNEVENDKNTRKDAASTNNPISDC